MGIHSVNWGIQIPNSLQEKSTSRLVARYPSSHANWTDVPAVYLPLCISWEINFIVPFPGVGSGQVPKVIVYIYIYTLVICMFENCMVGCIDIKFSVNSLFHKHIYFDTYI